jgi:hypothetical protein
VPLTSAAPGGPHDREPAPLAVARWVAAPGWPVHPLALVGGRRVETVALPAPVQAHQGTVPPPAPRDQARVAVARGRPAPAVGGNRDGAPRVLATVLDDVLACAAAPAGTGSSDRLNRAACTAGGLAAAGHLTQAEAERLLVEVAARARPSQERRSPAIIRGGPAAGATRPLHPGGSRS